MMQTYKRLPVEFVLGEGARLYDAQGGEYLDFLAGISVCNAGHCHPRIVEAIRDQAGRLQQVSNLYYNEPAARLAERLATSFEPGARVFLCNSGTEANEAAIKLARKHRRGGEIVVLEGAFHGRTMGALSATPQPDKQEPFAPLVPGLPGRAARRSRRARRGCGRRNRGGDAGARAGRDRRVADLGADAAGGTRGVRPVGRAADLRRDPVRDGSHRHAVGVRAHARAPGRADDRQGAGERPAGGRVHRGPAGGGRPAARRPRGDLRGRAAGGRRRARDPRRSSTTTRCCRVCACSATACASGSRSCAPPGGCPTCVGAG